MTVSTTKTKGPAQSMGDILRTEFHPQYCRVSGKLVNPSSTAITDQIPLGQPVKASGSDYVFVKATDEASAIGIVLHDKPITLAGSATSDLPYPILIRGPATIDQDALPAKDMDAGGGSAGTSFTIATLITAYAGLSPKIVAVRELTPTKTQSL